MDTAQLHRRFYEAFTQHDFDTMSPMVAEEIDYCDLSLGITFTRGPQFMEYYGSWFGAFPDAGVDRCTYWGFGNASLCRGRFYGTNTGKLGGADPTNKPISVPFFEIFHWNEKGQIIRGEAMYEGFLVAQQLGKIKGGLGDWLSFVDPND